MLATIVYLAGIAEPCVRLPKSAIPYIVVHALVRFGLQITVQRIAYILKKVLSLCQGITAIFWTAGPLYSAVLLPYLADMIFPRVAVEQPILLLSLRDMNDSMVIVASARTMLQQQQHHPKALEPHHPYTREQAYYRRQEGQA